MVKIKTTTPHINQYFYRSPNHTLYIYTYDIIGQMIRDSEDAFNGRFYGAENDFSSTTNHMIAEVIIRMRK